MILVLFFGVFTGGDAAYASARKNEARSIAIVFDNSGSMYYDGELAWCRATYAMEVFASMLNDGDTLSIYPMNTIEVDGKDYSMESPMKITSVAQASGIRDIYTSYAGDTPIESVDCAIEGLQSAQSKKKYLIILTDGASFYKDGKELSSANTQKELDERVRAQVEEGVTVMYLGIGTSACMPATEESDFFVKRQTANSADVLSVLTEMCNLVFGRDILPQNHISGNTVDFDVSISKLIVFAQGEDVVNLKVTGSSGGAAGELAGTQQTKYSTVGCGNYTSTPDTSLQGMMVTYTDCKAGSYTISYEGDASNVEIYYEPDAELEFVFTDADGNTVDYNALYEGDYKVAFGLMDGVTGELISSDLIGNPSYQGAYNINGEEISFSDEGYSGEISIPLELGDSFSAELTATYLDGYTITKNCSDFGWPEEGIQVVARPAGELQLAISGGEDVYSLRRLEEGAPYVAEVYYGGEKLTGSALESVDLKWDPDTSNVEITKQLVDDYYLLSLDYKDPEAPQDTVCGECTVSIYAFYTEKGSAEARAETALTYNVEDDFSPVQTEIYAPKDYIVISELEDSPEIVVTLSKEGEPLNAEEFASVALAVDSGGIAYTATPCEQASQYSIKLHSTDGIAKGDYSVTATAAYTDEIGRVTESDDTVIITLSNIPLALKWLIGLLILAALIVAAILISRIRVMPKKLHVNKKTSTMLFDGEDDTANTSFEALLKKNKLDIRSGYSGVKTGLTMAVKPGKESYLRKKQTGRSVEVDSKSVRKIGNAGAIIHEATIGTTKYILNEETGKLECAQKTGKPFTLKNNARVTYTGVMQSAGISRPFNVATKLDFKKKK